MGSSKLISLAVAGIFIFSCGKSYLEKEPLGQLDEAAVANKKGVERLLIGTYSVLDGIGGNKGSWFSAASNWIYGSICGSEAYKGGSSENDQGPEITPVELFTHTANNAAIASKWGAVYDGVQRANDVLRMMKKAKDISPADQKRIEAEARFLRAHYHFEAKKMWNKIPFIDETISYENGNYRVSNNKDAWPDIENDLKFAIDNLEITPYAGAVGRANKYTAMAVLAKAYMFQKKFAQAKPLIETIITSNKYRLLENYGANFDPANRNSAESIFSVQVSVNDGSAGMNGNFGDVLNFPISGPGGGCCGFFQPSQYLVNHFKTTAGLPELDHFNDVPVKNDEGLDIGDPFDPYAGPLDPRLDWTVGRRGIPYLDWGLHTGKDWIAAENFFFGPYSPKKNVYYKWQQGLLTDVSFWSNGTTTNNVNLIRYADVLLWAAEMEAEIGSLGQAEMYVNRIRKRMADHHESWVHKYLDNDHPEAGSHTDDAHLAANYVISPYPNGYFNNKDMALKAIRFERMLELGMEGHRFFDLVRWGIANVEIHAYVDKEKLKRAYLGQSQFTKNKSEYFAIPQLQIDLSAGADGNAKMTQNPGY